jgi:hypothetical protein
MAGKQKSEVIPDSSLRLGEDWTIHKSVKLKSEENSRSIRFVIYIKKQMLNVAMLMSELPTGAVLVCQSVLNNGLAIC